MANYPPTKIATMASVREYAEGDPVELWVNESGRITVRAYNECGNNYTDVDLMDLIDWTKSGPGQEILIDGGSGTAG